MLTQREQISGKVCWHYENSTTKSQRCQTRPIEIVAYLPDYTTEQPHTIMIGTAKEPTSVLGPIC